jgi:hypothetical protein
VLERVHDLPRCHQPLFASSIADLIPASIQFEYDSADLATKITTEMVHKSNSKTYV